MKEWTLIDYDFRDKLPKEDCEIWITRTMFTEERWVQKVDFYVEARDIEWDGTIAWMIAEENDEQPEPFNDEYIITIQNAR